MKVLIICPPDSDFSLAGKLFNLDKTPYEGEVEIIEETGNKILFKFPEHETIYSWSTGHLRRGKQGEMRLIDTNNTVLKVVTNHDLQSVGHEDDAIVDDDIELEITGRRLIDIEFDPRKSVPLRTGTIVDEFFSRAVGVLPGTNIMVTGDPGIGKSANLIEIITLIKKNMGDNVKIGYISAEMDEDDCREFIKFYPEFNSVPILLMADYLYGEGAKLPISAVVKGYLNNGFDIVVLDSIIEVQSIIQEELGLTQKKGEAWMLDLMRTHNKGNNRRNAYTAFLSIQQKNKGGQYVGSKRLEHMTTAFLQLLWDTKEKGKRYMVFEKNRKGKEKVRLYYNFANESGIKYDEKRYRTELQVLEKLQQTGADLEQMELEEFENMFTNENE